MTQTVVGPQTLLFYLTILMICDIEPIRERLIHSVRREALLFGHVYEGEGGMVKFGEIKIGEYGFAGSRAVAMPGVQIESEGNLSALSLAMKEEIIRSR